MTELKQKNIDWAADRIAEIVYYRNNDSSHREKLKDALKIFANILLMDESANEQKPFSLNNSNN